MRLARELGYTVMELGERITLEELKLWAMLFEVEHAEEEEQRRKAKRR